MVDGWFGLYMYQNKTSKKGWYVFLNSVITLHVKDRKLLEEFKAKNLGQGLSLKTEII
jgi:hypothetical protein